MKKEEVLDKATKNEEINNIPQPLPEYIPNDGLSDIYKTVSDFLLSYSTLIWVLVLSFIAGSVRVIEHRREGNKVTIRYWLEECFISGFIGYLVFNALTLADASEPTIAIVVAISAHMGAKAIDIIRNYVLTRLHKKFKAPKDDKQ